MWFVFQKHAHNSTTEGTLTQHLCVGVCVGLMCLISNLCWPGASPLDFLLSARLHVLCLSTEPSVLAGC